jgi:hypothetical protein
MFEFMAFGASHLPTIEHQHDRHHLIRVTALGQAVHLNENPIPPTPYQWFVGSSFQYKNRLFVNSDHFISTEEDWALSPTTTALSESLFCTAS